LQVLHCHVHHAGYQSMLVISPSASAEAVRLAKQATVIEPFALTTELVDLVTIIDGAVLIDLDGTCHAIV